MSKSLSTAVSVFLGVAAVVAITSIIFLFADNPVAPYFTGLSGPVLESSFWVRVWWWLLVWSGLHLILGFVRAADRKAQDANKSTVYWLYIFVFNGLLFIPGSILLYQCTDFKRVAVSIGAYIALVLSYLGVGIPLVVTVGQALSELDGTSFTVV
jgi:ABC-type antimicrobial peptide transport system permease subunit